MKRHHILLEVGKHKVFPMEEHPELRAEGTFEHPLKAPLSAIQWRSSWTSSLFRCRTQLQWTKYRRRRTFLEVEMISTWSFGTVLDRHHEKDNLNQNIYLRKVDSIHALTVLSILSPQSILIDDSQTIWWGMTSDGVRSLSKCCAWTWPIDRNKKIKYP